MRWLVDGNNVMGANVPRWWNDPVAGAVKLLRGIATWCIEHPDHEVLVVFDGKPDDRLRQVAGGNLRVDFATRSGRDAADDRIVELVDELFVEPDLTVVTSDKGLVGRLPPGLAVLGAGAYGTFLGLR